MLVNNSDLYIIGMSRSRVEWATKRDGKTVVTFVTEPELLAQMFPENSTLDEFYILFLLILFMITSCQQLNFLKIKFCMSSDLNSHMSLEPDDLPVVFKKRLCADACMV